MEIMLPKSIFVLHPSCEPIPIVGASEGQLDVWWGWTCVWVGPVTWGIVEVHCWGSGTSMACQEGARCIRGGQRVCMGPCGMCWGFGQKGGQMCGGARCVSQWGQMHVWVGPVVWGVVEGCCWGSGTSLSGLGYVVRPGDMVGCMECGTESAKAAVRRVARCDRQVGRGDGCGVMDEQAWPTWVDWHGEHGERDGRVQRVTGFG